MDENVVIGLPKAYSAEYKWKYWQTYYVCLLFHWKLLCFRTVGGDFWHKLFERFLNADGKSTVPLLRELREELSDKFDSGFQKHLYEFLAAALGDIIVLDNFIWFHREQILSSGL